MTGVREPSTGFPEFPDKGPNAVGIDLATRDKSSQWHGGIQFYTPSSTDNLSRLRMKIINKADQQLSSPPSKISILEVDLTKVESVDFPPIAIKSSSKYKIIVHFTDKTVTY